MEQIGYEEGSLRALEQLIGAHNRVDIYTDEDQRVRLLSVVMGCKAHPDINAAARRAD